MSLDQEMPGLLSDAWKLYPGRFTHLGSRQFQQHLCERAEHPGEPWLAGSWVSAADRTWDHLLAQGNCDLRGWWQVMLIPLRKTDVNIFSSGWEGCEDSKCMQLHCDWSLHWIQALEEAKGAMSSICSCLACQEQTYAWKVREGRTAGTWDK